MNNTSDKALTRWLLRVLNDPKYGAIRAAEDNERVLGAISAVIALLERDIKGDAPSRDEWDRAAAEVGWAAREAAEAAARAAARAARWAVWAATGAADVGWAAEAGWAAAGAVRAAWWTAAEAAGAVRKAQLNWTIKLLSLTS